jgi:Tfp pilus assembly protein PilF
MNSQNPTAKSKIVALSFVLTALMLPNFAHSTPYVPANGTMVVETLKKDARQRELQVMRKLVAANPGNIYAVSELTQRYISEARDTGDPRYLGYAQATLAPWWKLADAPTQILVLRATILQSTHQFTAALNDLNLVLRKDRNNPQAWLTRATIQQVTGNYFEAKASCMHLVSLAPEIIATTCLNNIASLNGEAEKSYASLADIYKKSPQIDPSIKIWTLTLLAEMSARRGDAVAAQSWYKRALSIDTPDSYLLGSYADFLLDQNKNAEVATLLKEKTRVDALLLRYAIALQNQKSSLAQEQIDTLEQRFNAATMREDSVHQREHARFELQIKNRPAAALVLAQKNWAIQKEAADLRIYLESALANNSREAALPALTWLKTNKLEDKAVQALVEKLGGAV